MGGIPNLRKTILFTRPSSEKARIIIAFIGRNKQINQPEMNYRLFLPHAFTLIITCFSLPAQELSSRQDVWEQMVMSTKSDDWSWIDAIQMSMPVFAKLGTVLDDTSYYRKMYDLYSFTKYQHGDSGLYNRQDHLWWRDGNFDPPVTTPNGFNMYWSRGNGWVCVASTTLGHWVE